jgi:hypothetical protein
MKELKLIIILIILFQIPCKANWTGSSIFHAHALQTGDSSFSELKKLIPKGYYILSESGAREALKAKIDADSYWSQLSETRKIVTKKDSIINNQVLAIIEVKQSAKDNKLAAQKLKREAFWQSVEIWGYRALIVVFTLSKTGIIK